MTSVPVHAEGASGLLLSRSRVPLPPWRRARDSRKAQGRRQSEPDRREPPPQAPKPTNGI
jgi:hypothetical protein